MTDFRGPLRKDDYKVLALSLVIPMGVIGVVYFVSLFLIWIGL
jgi:hypothetical protein